MASAKKVREEKILLESDFSRVAAASTNRRANWQHFSTPRAKRDRFAGNAVVVASFRGSFVPSRLTVRA
jgi:hypothetical protein